MKKIFLILCILFSLTTYAESNSDYLNINFWQKFNDDKLLENLTIAYNNNHDLKAAVLKVQEAQRVVKLSFANELPYFGFEGYIGQTFKSSDERFGHEVIPDFTQSHFLLPLNMNYEIDIWQENRLKTKSKKKQFEMIKQDERSTYILITSALACDYYNLIRIDKLIEYQNELINLSEQILYSQQRKYELGTATKTEIEEAQKNLTYLKEELLKLKEKQDVLENQMNVILADRSFNEIKRKDFSDISFNMEIPEKINFEVLEKRPDRIKSELELEKKGIDIKIAKKDFLPKFYLTGNLGFNMYNLHTAHKFLADIGVIPVFDIFAGGKKVQNLKLKKDEYEIAIQHYEKIILKSMQETNDALYSLKTAAKIINITDERKETDIKELNYTELKKEAGTKDNLDILIQKQKLILSQKQEVSAKINEIISSINLYQALGGIDFNEIETL